MNKKTSNRIQKRILLITVSVILAMGIIIAGISSYIYSKYLQNSLLQSTENNLRFLVESMENNLNNVTQLTRWCQTNKTISEYVESGNDNDPLLALTAHERLTEQYQSSGASNYIHRAIIANNDGDYIQIVSSSYSSTINVAKEAPKQDYFDTLLNSHGYNFSFGILPDSFYRGNAKGIIPIVRPIMYKYNSTQGGWVLLQLSPDIFAAPINGYTLAEDSAIYLTLGQYTYLYDHGSFLPIDADTYEVLADVSDSLRTENTHATQIRTSDDRSVLLVSKPLSVEGCYVSQTISAQELSAQQNIYIYILLIIVFAIILIWCMLFVLLNRTISKPVLKIRDKMNRISAGDFTRDTDIEWNHELGDIGRGINDLSENVVTLMNTRIEDEKKKQELEYQVLQSQINPHFLYNTLNSIKWMAVTQGSTGIAEMTTALSRLLKSISKGTAGIIPLREEIALLDDYFTIQQYRYGGAITMDYEIEDETLKDVDILRFTMQPLVENAIFHGIEPKGASGAIHIHILQNSEHQVQIDIMDNGIGMSKETISSLFTEKQTGDSKLFKEIGISNVHKRLQYEFGAAYGLRITSELGKSTTMTILIPDTREPHTQIPDTDRTPAQNPEDETEGSLHV